MHGEAVGHHIRGWEREFLAVAYAGAEASPTVRMMLPSEVLDTFPSGDFVEPFASSWSTSRDDIASGDPFPLWKSPGNRLRVKRTDAAVNMRIVRQGAARRNAQGHTHRTPHVISAMAMEKMTSATGMAST